LLSDFQRHNAALAPGGHDNPRTIGCERNIEQSFHVHQDGWKEII